MKKKPTRKPTNAAIEAFIRKAIYARQAWASSPAGRDVLGPGSPIVPGLQEYYHILDYVQGRRAAPVDHGRKTSR